MAHRNNKYFIAASLLAIILCALIPTCTSSRGARLLSSTSPCIPFNPVLGFGDSTSDTGNAIHASNDIFSWASHAPYGETFFKHPTGRYSDGRLMVDYLCAALNIPFLPPHLARPANYANENFAVAGATSLDLVTLQQLANVTSLTPDSLDVQLGWFKNDTAQFDLSDALVYFGEIGGNDYNYALAARKPPQVVASLIPPVIEKIATALNEILSSGVKKVVVQGQFPMGCISLYLKVLNGSQTDAHGCIEAVMQVSDEHNWLLKQAVANVTKMHPGAETVFFDTSAAYVHILGNAAKYNFTDVQDPCYAAGIALLLSPASSSGATSGASGAALPAPAVEATACPNPENYVGWDGIHLTDAMYGTMMKLFLTSPEFSSPFPNFLTSAIACGHA